MRIKSHPLRHMALFSILFSSDYKMALGTCPNISPNT
jgi:hypothetical protein